MLWEIIVFVSEKFFRKRRFPIDSKDVYPMYKTIKTQGYNKSFCIVYLIVFVFINYDIICFIVCD